VGAFVSIQSIADSGLASGVGGAAGYLGAALGVAMVLPQIARTYRDRALVGVSALTWALTALSCLTWLLYGVRAEEVPQIPGNVLTVAGAVVIVLAVPSSISRGARAARLVLAAAALIALAAVLAPTVLGFVAFGIGMVSALPQIARSLLGSGGAAVSIPTWLLYGAAQVCWLTYALIHHDAVVTVSAVFLIISSVLVSGGEGFRRVGRDAARGVRLDDGEVGRCAA
jgi:uncharacterized protein with PQ loop repeat